MFPYAEVNRSIHLSGRWLTLHKKGSTSLFPWKYTELSTHYGWMGGHLLWIGWQIRLTPRIYTLSYCLPTTNWLKSYPEIVYLLTTKLAIKVQASLHPKYTVSGNQYAWIPLRLHWVHRELHLRRLRALNLGPNVLWIIGTGRLIGVLSYSEWWGDLWVAWRLHWSKRWSQNKEAEGDENWNVHEVK